MNSDRKKRANAWWINHCIGLIEFLSEDEPLTEEEVDAELRAHGFDPDKVGAKMKQVALNALMQVEIDDE